MSDPKKKVRRYLVFFLPSALLTLCGVSGCTPNLRSASPSEADVFFALPRETKPHERFRCGYLAARQVIKFYRPGIRDDEFKTDALIFQRANDTTSILLFLKDNLSATPVLTNGTPENLFHSLRSGEPVIVFVHADFFSPQAFPPIANDFYHCLVISGFNSQATEMFFYSDGQGPFAINRNLFQEEWRQVINLCIILNRGFRKE